jgi:hypothetical protein
MAIFLIGLMAVLPERLSSQDMPLKKKEVPATHSIRRAALYSMALPGMGQAYNKKYWKIPVIYAGFGAFTYFIVTNNQEYTQFKDAYVYTANGETYPTDNPYVGKYNQTQLKEAMDFYRRNRDLSVILGVVWYTLNILEAYVDAHFYDYDVSDDLSMRVSPSVINMPLAPLKPAPGIQLSLKF